MAVRLLPDGSKLDTDTGDLLVGNQAREAAARAASAQGGYRRPVRNKGQQIMDVAPVGSHNVILPVQNLRVSPNSAMGALGALSDGSKKMLLTGLIAAAAFGAVWLNGKMKSQKKGKK